MLSDLDDYLSILSWTETEAVLDAGPLVEAEELVMPKEGTYARPAAVTQVDRSPGQNDVGIVAWLLTLKTPECPQGRQVRYNMATSADSLLCLACRAMTMMPLVACFISLYDSLNLKS